MQICRRIAGEISTGFSVGISIEIFERLAVGHSGKISRWIPKTILGVIEILPKFWENPVRTLELLLWKSNEEFLKNSPQNVLDGWTYLKKIVIEILGAGGLSEGICKRLSAENHGRKLHRNLRWHSLGNHWTNSCENIDKFLRNSEKTPGGTNSRSIHRRSFKWILVKNLSFSGNVRSSFYTNLWNSCWNLERIAVENPD